MTEIVVATTLAAFAMDNPDTWGAWLYSAQAIKADAQQARKSIKFFAAIELDARGLEPFASLLDKLQELDAEYWTYTLDDGRTEVTTGNRLRHLTMGQNLVSEYATSNGMEWMLFLAADCRPPDDVFTKLLEMDHPIVGPEIRTYCLSGPVVHEFPFPVQQHMISAACIFIHRSIFKQLRWRVDPDLGMTDDPSYAHDAKNMLGYNSYVRKDIFAQHYPESIGGIETRGHDLKVHR